MKDLTVAKKKRAHTITGPLFLVQKFKKNLRGEAVQVYFCKTHFEHLKVKSRINFKK
jgi:hypothetical protein